MTMFRGSSRLALAVCSVTFATACVTDQTGPRDIAEPAAFDAVGCRALATRASSGSSFPDLAITQATWHEAGTVRPDRAPDANLPAHCEVLGSFRSHPGVVGGPYQTGFRMRLPAGWNGKFLFEGGGGSNGVVRDGTGATGFGNAPGLQRGYAVIAQDSGHDNNNNSVPELGGEYVFGHDPQARRDYGHESLKAVYDLGQYLIHQAYGREASTKLFFGCSKGGQEGMAFAQRYPDAFDGIVAMAPGFSLPRAAVQQAWATQRFSGIVRARGGTPSLQTLKGAFSQAQVTRLGETILTACDGMDGAVDGMVSAVGACTSDRILPELRRQICAADSGEGCFEPTQVDALAAVMGGARNSRGDALYTAFPWDPGMATPGWLGWTTGFEGGPTARNVTLGAGTLAAVFTSPPTKLPNDPQAMLAWQLAFDFDRDAPKIYAVTPPFTTSAWDDIGMRSSDLSAFRAQGGKLIVPHGAADPVFSVLDTIQWWTEVNQRSAGNAAGFVRVFPVPGMNHCGGGPSTDRFDAFAALENWVEKGKAPDFIPAHAGPDAPWPGREMPLCPYPNIALPTGETANLGGYRCGAPPTRSDR